MAEEKRSPLIISEDEVPASWTPVEAEPIDPNGAASAPPPSAGSLPPYFRGTLSPNLQHDAQFVATDKNPRIASIPLMPQAPSANPQNNAGIQTLIKSTVTTATDIDPYLFFRGTWQSFVSYNINDVVVQNLSTYVAVTSSTGLRPDQNTNAWTILGENLVFNPSTVGLPQAGGFGNFDGQLLNTSVSTGLNTPKVGPLTPSTAGDFAFLAITQRETDLDTTWKVLYQNGSTDGVFIKSLATAATLGPIVLGSTSFPWGANLLFFKGNGASLTGTITATAVNNNVVTVTCANNFIVGTTVTFAGLTTGGFLDGQLLVIQSATPTQFTVNFTHANYGTTADTGTATWLMYRQSVQASFPGTNNSVTINHLQFPNPVQAGSVLLFVGITNDNNANAGLVSIADTVGNVWSAFGDGHFGCAGSVGYCQSSKPGTVNMACSGVWSSPSDVGMAFEFPGAVLQGWEPYDVVEFRGSMFVCLRETIFDAFAAPTSWALIGPGVGYVDILSGNYTAVATDSGRLLSFNSSSAVTLTLPNPVPAPPSGTSETGWMIFIQNIGTGTLTISNNSLTIDGVAGNLTLGQNQGVVIFADSTGNYETYHGMNSLIVPAIFTVTVPNGSGQVTLGLATQNANLFFAGPTSGGAATPTFRLIANADLPVTVPTVPPEFTLTGNVASPAGVLTLGKATQAANTFWRGPTSGAPAVPVFGPIVSADLPPLVVPPLAVSVVVLTQTTTSKSGVFLINGARPPAGVYRVSTNFFLQANPSAGTLDIAIGWNDGIATRSATNGTLGAPADISTAGLNVADGTIVIVSDGLHDITWAMNLT